MPKIFEDVFMEVQADMISLGIDYVESQAEKVFIYASNEEGAMDFNVFYQIKGQIVTTDEVNAVVDKKIDDSDDKTFDMLGMGLDYFKQLDYVCNEYDRPIPTEIRLTYDVRANSLKSDYQYEPVYINTKDLDSSDIFMEWVEAEKNK